MSEAFRQFLEEGGILDALSRAIVAFSEKPVGDPMEFIRNFIQEPIAVNFNALLEENQKLKKEHNELEEKLNSMKQAAE